MKLQHLTVIFAIIFLPIIIITSYFIQRQVDTIDLQLSYDSKLLDATYDALTAFELNTANEDLSSVSDQLRSIVEASNNIFFNTLATNMGISNASKTYVQPYIPAILYTLYDGYYIYSPTSSPVVCTDSYGQTIDTSSYGVCYLSESDGIGFYCFNEDAVEYYDTTATGVKTSGTCSICGHSYSDHQVVYDDLPDDIKTEYGQLLYKNKDGTTWSTELHEGCTDPNDDTKYTQSYMLKSYVSYTAEYSSGDIDVTINYTLDNFISISGTIGDIYYTKSGYLIDSNFVTDVTVNGSSINWYTYSEEDLEEEIDNGTTIVVTLSDGTTISTDEGYTTNSTNQDCKDAVEYYVEAWMFSSWVYKNLNTLQESDIQNVYEISSATSSLETYSSLIHDFSGSSDAIFDSTSDPEDDESTFAEHKRNVIKNSIMYNLSLAMVSYSQMSKLVEFEMPIISDVEWDSILSNVSMVTFMQGLSCGLKYYNNYAVATSTNNEVTVTPSEIYYVAADSSTTLDDDTYETAHRIDCTNLSSSTYYLSFKSKEIKYDKIYDSSSGTYIYDHMAKLDYTCIVNGNYWLTFAASSGTTYLRGNADLLKNLDAIADSNKIKAYRIAVAKERNNLYKAVEYDTNYGWRIFRISDSTINVSTANTTNAVGYTSGFSSDDIISNIYKIEVVVSNIERNSSLLSSYTTDTLILSYGASVSSADASVESEPISFSLSSGTTTRVFYIDDPDNTNQMNSILLKLKYGSGITINSIKFYYK